MRSIPAICLSAAAGLALIAGPALAASAVPNNWPAENITGKIVMVDPALKTVVIDYSGGVPMDLVVTPTTRIDANQHAVQLTNLSQYMNRQVTVRFVPERRGDVAKSIHIAG